jgi:protein-disulfide isomerase
LRHVAQLVAVFVLALVAFGFGPAPASAADGTLTETALGDPNAPVTIIEYSSLTCPHCAAFHRDTLPQVKTSYIDTGKVRLVYRDFPLGKLALAAAVVGRCVDPSRHFAFIDMLYRDQDAWSQSRDPLAELKLRAQLAGLSDSQFEACLGNKPLIQAVQQRAQEGQQEYGIDSTPSFIVNGKKISGEQSFEAFSKAIDAALAEAG